MDMKAYRNQTEISGAFGRGWDGWLGHGDEMEIE